MEFIILIAVFGLLMWMMSRGARKQRQAATDMRAGLEVGQQVMTASGFYGTIVDIDGDVITLESTPGNETMWKREAIQGVSEPPFAVEEDAVEDSAVTGATAPDGGALPDGVTGAAVPDDASSLTESGDLAEPGDRPGGDDLDEPDDLAKPGDLLIEDPKTAPGGATAPDGASASGGATAQGGPAGERGPDRPVISPDAEDDADDKRQA